MHQNAFFQEYKMDISSISDERQWNVADEIDVRRKCMPIITIQPPGLIKYLWFTTPPP